MIARNEDAGGGVNAKRFVVVNPTDQPSEYVSTFNQFRVKLPNNPPKHPTLTLVMASGANPALTPTTLP